MKYINIVISGDVGTGKSTIAKGLAQKLGWEYESIGDFFRKYTLEHNISLQDVTKIPKDINNKVDFGFREKFKTEKDYVFEGHYQGWNAKDCPQTFRILITADPVVVAKRIVDRVHTHTETAEQLFERGKQLRIGFKNLYGNDDYLDSSFFNIVVDNSEHPIEESIQIVYDAFVEGNN